MSFSYSLATTTLKSQQTHIEDVNIGKCSMSAEKTVLITGSSSGFGYLTAKRLAEDGFRVYASGKRGT
jgi:NADP-dependent 3-hydroxy acid dehydrogenase YdfG